MDRAEQKAEAERLRAEDPKRWTFPVLGKRYGVSRVAIYYWLNPGKRERYAEDMRVARAFHLEDDRDPPIPPKPNVEDTRSLTARLFGDPLPGRSALDRERTQ